MDLEEWELLSDDGFIDQLQTQDGSLKRAISREALAAYPNSTIDMDYFQKLIDPQKKKHEMDPGEAIPPNLVIPVPVEFDLPSPESPKPSLPDDAVVKEVIQGDKEETLSPQVFFKKTGENEFADMKLDLPKSTSRDLSPQTDLGNPQFEEYDDDDDDDDGWKSPKEGLFVKADEGECEFNCNEKEEKEWEDGSNQGGLNIWKMGMTGFGALCSFGFACATICVIALGCRHRERPQDQKLHFQIYADDKRIKQVVHHASKLNEAISVVRGAPISRAHITIGGYFEGL